MIEYRKGSLLRLTNALQELMESGWGVQGGKTRAKAKVKRPPKTASKSSLVQFLFNSIIVYEVHIVERGLAKSRG